MQCMNKTQWLQLNSVCGSLTLSISDAVPRAMQQNHNAQRVASDGDMGH